MKDNFLLAWRGLKFLFFFIVKFLLIGFLYIAIMLYHDEISNFIGAHFFYPKTRILIFPDLVLEAYIIEAVVCLPLSLLLVWTYQGLAIPIALLLTKPVIARATTDFYFAAMFSTRPINEPGLIAYHALCHFCFLFIGTILLWQNSTG
jgi:hypothetical protein